MPLTVSIIIPVYNEEKTLACTADKLKALDIDKELIFVDDGSTDSSYKILESIKAEHIKIARHPVNKGKGAAIITGIGHASGGIIAVQDADLEYNPQELLSLIEPIQNGKYDIVFGSRFLKNNPILYYQYYFGNKLMSFFISLLALKRVTDPYTCYKVFNASFLKELNLSSTGFEIEAELSILSLLSRKKMIELPISYTPRKIKEGKKIKLKDLFKGLLKAFITRAKFKHA